MDNETIYEAAMRLGNQVQGRKIFSMICRACGESLERVLSNLDELPNCPKCGSEMLVNNVTKEKH